MAKKKQKWVKGQVLIEVLGGVATLNEEKSDPDVKVIIKDYDNEEDSGPAIAG